MPKNVAPPAPHAAGFPGPSSTPPDTGAPLTVSPHATPPAALNSSLPAAHRNTPIDTLPSFSASVPVHDSSMFFGSFVSMGTSHAAPITAFTGADVPIHPQAQSSTAQLQPGPMQPWRATAQQPSRAVLGEVFPPMRGPLGTYIPASHTSLRGLQGMVEGGGVEGLTQQGMTRQGMTYPNMGPGRFEEVPEAEGEGKVSSASISDKAREGGGGMRRKGLNGGSTGAHLGERKGGVEDQTDRVQGGLESQGAEGGQREEGLCEGVSGEALSRGRKEGGEGVEGNMFGRDPEKDGKGVDGEALEAGLEGAGGGESSSSSYSQEQEGPPSPPPSETIAFASGPLGPNTDGTYSGVPVF